MYLRQSRVPSPAATGSAHNPAGICNSQSTDIKPLARINRAQANSTIGWKTQGPSAAGGSHPFGSVPPASSCFFSPQCNNKLINIGPNSSGYYSPCPKPTLQRQVLPVLDRQTYRNAVYQSLEWILGSRLPFQCQGHNLLSATIALTHPLHPKSVLQGEPEQLQTNCTFGAQQHPEASFTEQAPCRETKPRSIHISLQHLHLLLT